MFAPPGRTVFRGGGFRVRLVEQVISNCLEHGPCPMIATLELEIARYWDCSNVSLPLFAELSLPQFQQTETSLPGHLRDGQRALAAIRCVNWQAPPVPYRFVSRLVLPSNGRNSSATSFRLQPPAASLVGCDGRRSTFLRSRFSPVIARPENGRPLSRPRSPSRRFPMAAWSMSPRWGTFVRRRRFFIFARAIGGRPAELCLT